MNINLISNDNGVGLSQDMRIVKSILKGHKCTIVDMLKHQQPPKADINIHFEILNNLNYHSAPVNLFFPNPEWFDFPAMLKGIDLVLCKTKDSERIFSRMTRKTVYTSFTSEDHYQPFDEVEQRVYLHTAGQSRAKGTDAVFKAWKQDYPDLILTKLNNFKRYERHPENLLTCFQRIEKPLLLEIQNKCTFHLCPSECEGFGHYIWEAKSCRGIVITTDAPPMNEMVTEGVDGFLVKANISRRVKFARAHTVDVTHLQQVIEKTFTLTDKEIERMRKASRASWERNDKFFKDKLLQIISGYGS